MKLYKLLIIFLLSTIIIFGFQSYKFSQQNNQDSDEKKSEQINNLENSIIPAQTPFPFEELTIPYLKNRDYQSSIGEQNQVDSNSDYTSYLTSYQSDGLQINSLLTIPNGEKPESGWPAIIFIHGYIPPQNYQTQKNYASYVDYLAKNGFVVLKIDLRGHGDSEGDASGAYYSGDYIVDTLNAYSALENADFVDKNKIYLWGHSMAGNVVMRSLAAKPIIPKVVIWAGAVYTYNDFKEFRISDNSYRPPETRSEHSQNRQELIELYGEFDPTSWFWQQVPATNHLDEVRGEIEIHHAVDDEIVNIGYSRNLDKILEDANIKHQLFEYSSGGHNISGSSFTTAMQRTVDFLKK